MFEQSLNTEVMGVLPQPNAIVAMYIKGLDLWAIVISRSVVLVTVGAFESEWAGSHLLGSDSVIYQYAGCVDHRIL